MLHVETVEPGTFSVLKQLMEMPELSGFSLVGGTALSLLYGHRRSIDIDLFSTKVFENDAILQLLQTRFKSSFDNRTTSPQVGIFCFINNVKVDLVRHVHPLVSPIQNIEGIRMFP